MSRVQVPRVKRAYARTTGTTEDAAAALGLVALPGQLDHRTMPLSKLG